MGVEPVEQGVTLCLNQTFDRVAAHGIEIEARAPGLWVFADQRLPATG